MATASDLRVAVSELTVVAAADLDALWAAVYDAVSAREALEDVLPGLVEVYGLAASALAADWYDDTRWDLNVSGRFTAVPADVEDTGADILARWGVAPLFAADPDWSAARSLIAGGLQRRIANASRATITRSSVLDPQSRGWRRIGDGHSCDFCTLLLGRGAVYTSETVKFRSHDNCGCGAAPEWA